jgi:hypothetical protein
MLDVAKRLRSPGYSQRSGRKLKRRSIQPHKEREKVRSVFFSIAVILMVIVLGIIFWWVTRDHRPIGHPDHQPVPTAPGGVN